MDSSFTRRRLAPWSGVSNIVCNNSNVWFNILSHKDYLIYASCPLYLTLEQADSIVVRVYSNKYVVVVLSLEGSVFPPFFFLCLNHDIYIDKVLLPGQLCSLYFSFSRTLSRFLLHTLGSMPVSHCRFMHACIANTSVRCIFGNEHVNKEKKVFLSFFFLRCKTARQSSSTRLFTPWYIHSFKKRNGTIYNDCLTMMCKYGFFFFLSALPFLSFFFFFFFSFVSFDYSAGVSVVLLLLL